MDFRNNRRDGGGDSKLPLTEEQKYYRKMRTRRFIVVIIILAVLVYLIHVIVNLIKSPSDTFVIAKGKVELEDTTTGLIIRDETVIKTDETSENGLEQIAVEGQKVARGEAVLRYYTTSEDTIKAQIKELDTQINSALDKEKISSYSGDMKIIDDQILEKLNDIYKFNDINKISEYKKDLDSYMSKKTKIAGELSPEGSNLRALISQRTELENQLNQNSKYINAPIAGIVSYRVDGFEEKLSSTTFNSLTKDTINEIPTKTGEIISGTSEVGKVVDNFTCYIACVIKSENAKDVEVGRKLKIRLSNSEETKAEVVYAVDTDNGEKLLVLKINKYVEELVNYRKIMIDIIWWDETGLRVPNDALKYEKTSTDKDIAYVIRRRTGYDDKIYVKIDKQTDKYSIIENYKSDELKELGIDSKIISDMRSINMYDSVLTK